MLENKLTVLFRTRGGHKEGMGDVTSSVALAAEFMRQGHSVLFMTNHNPRVVGLIESQGFERITVDDAEEIARHAKGAVFDIAVLNRLDTPVAEGLVLRERSRIMATVEDTGATSELADLRFNTLYPIKNAFTDFSFIPLAETFQKKHKVSMKIGEKVRMILVTQGGSDTYGFTPKIIQALCCVPADIDINVVIGPNFTHDVDLNDALAQSPRKFNIIRGLSDLSEIMLGADIAVSAGGNTLFELACLGVPTIVLCGELFEVGTADRLAAEGFGVNLGFGRDADGSAIASGVRVLIGDVQLRKRMSERGKELIDGQGVMRMYGKIMDACYKAVEGMKV